MKNVFIYEKTYVFISVEPLCKLFEKIFTFIENYKKLNFYQQLEEYSSLLNNAKATTPAAAELTVALKSIS